MITIQKLTTELLDDYLDFFDHRAFSDGSPFFPCYCTAFNMSRERIQEEFFSRAEKNGGGSEGWKKALRDSAVRMVTGGEIRGYLAYDGDIAVGWCNAGDRLNYARVGEFDLSAVPPDEPCDGSLRRGQAKSIVCFEIAPEYRGKGIATLLLDTVCRDARDNGYEYVEAYPAKDEGLQGLAFTGPKRLYEKAGFTIVAQKGNTLIMRKQLMTDFSAVTACGECCTGCPKKLDGRCPGCIDADGRVPEWAESGRCRVHACTRDHHVQFCGLCAEFPCENLPSLISWNPDIVRRMTVLRDEYINVLSRAVSGRPNEKSHDTEC